MKRIVFFMTFVLSLAFLSSCRMPVAQEGGKSDVAYLLFVSPEHYYNKIVDVHFSTLEEDFTAKVVKEKKAMRKGKAYTVPTGRATVKVYYEGKLLYSRQLFLSTQQTKVIQLP